MPTYEYECAACRHRFERRQKIDEEPVRICPECGGATRRVLHPVGIIFKGSGWYITDSRSSSEGAGIPAPSEKAEKKDDSKNGSSNGTGGGDKAESKGESKTASAEKK